MDLMPVKESVSGVDKASWPVVMEADGIAAAECRSGVWAAVPVFGTSSLLPVDLQTPDLSAEPPSEMVGRAGSVAIEFCVLVSSAASIASSLFGTPNIAPKSNPLNNPTALSTISPLPKLMTPTVRCNVPSGLIALIGSLVSFPSCLDPAVTVGLVAEVGLTRVGVSPQRESGFGSERLGTIASVNVCNDARHCDAAWPLVRGRQRKWVRGGFLAGMEFVC